MDPVTAAILLVGAFPICVWVAWTDLSTMRIPNKSVVMLAAVWIVLGLLAVLVAGLTWLTWLKGLGLGLLGLAISFVGINLKALPGLVRLLAIVLGLAPVLWITLAPMFPVMATAQVSTYAIAVWLCGLATVYAAFIGGGDSKFMAAMAPFFVGASGFTIMKIFLPTFLGAFIAHRLCRAIPAIRSLAPHWVSWNAPQKKFPMGLALSGSLIFYLSAKVLPLF